MPAQLTLVQDGPTQRGFTYRGARNRAPSPEDDLSQLVRTLDAERRLIDDLRQALLRQRGAIAANDAAAIESTSEVIGRTLHALAEARRRRSDMMQALTGNGDARLATLEAYLGTPLPDGLETAREQLRRSAEATSHDVAINQHVLRRALEAGDAFLQRLFSSGADVIPTYTPAVGTPRPAAARGVLLNRSA